MKDGFVLDTRLENDAIYIADLPLCQLRLNNDSRYPWFILIPRVNNITEIIDLTQAQQQQLWQESAALSHWLKANYQHAKLNIAALGNVVSQLHLHHIVRFESDDAWPGPVWGKFLPTAYTEERKATLKQHFLDTFSLV
ncbi:HIT domain-containing protein [Rheinheimera sp. MMS21-TC3]|uniref:HIT domain-containing protein n=1 Tax=Rheinheimera sp. MMS21-TC3 TaxID=3072790 RepID=UPI0028C493E8|nr:HIT domain-containing protein [Rheinheimera sp. MMS21-TC3]WNO60551.1 HIT domain-containing protein [Rheinheimera sp. MMS21-TC3]